MRALRMHVGSHRLLRSLKISLSLYRLYAPFRGSWQTTYKFSNLSKISEDPHLLAGNTQPQSISRSCVVQEESHLGLLDLLIRLGLMRLLIQFLIETD